MGSELPLVALGPDSTDRLAKGAESTPQPSPQVATVGESKPPAKEGGGTLADVRIPSRQMDATDAAIVRGDRSAISVAVCAERRAWIEHASRVAIEVLREIDNAIGGKP